MGLHVQHGSQCSSGCTTEHLVERVQYQDLPEAQETMGSVAWADSGMDRDGDESGAARFPAMVGLYRCTQPVAFGHRGTNGLVV